MIPPELLREIRNDLPMKVTVFRLGQQGPISKEIEGHFRFRCPNCEELRATVNPRNNLAHCFCCGQNFNNIDLLMTTLGYDFVPAVELLEQWLRQYQAHRSRQPL
jgi:DNA primase